MNRFKEWLLELGGMKIWPPTHNDPRIKGPQPRILTKRQWEAMEKMRQEHDMDDDGHQLRRIVMCVMSIALLSWF